MLDTTIRKSNSVRSFSITSTITSLSSVESSLGVVISNTIGVSIGRRLIRVSNGSSVDKGSSMDKRGVICRSSMDNGGSMIYRSMDNRGMVCWCSMDNWSSMVDRGMVSMCSMDSYWNDSSMSNSNGLVSTNGRLNL